MHWRSDWLELWLGMISILDEVQVDGALALATQIIVRSGDTIDDNLYITRLT